MSLLPPGHPQGLLICFGTELWERFSYYGMRALLIFYLTQHFSFTDQESYAIYGAYTSLAWGLPVVGGILADRYLGPRKAVVLGAILLTCGHLLLAIEGPPATQTVTADGIVIERDADYLNLFYLSLGLIVSGVGFMKTNISTVVGALYTKDDPHRDAGFTIFYLGINLGSAIAPLLCGWLGQTYGWQYGFGMAGIGMLAGLLLFLWGQRFLGGLADPPDSARLRQKVFCGLSCEGLNYIAAAIMVLIAWQLIGNHRVLGDALGGFGIVLAVVILYFSFARCSPVERDRMLTVASLIVFSILFWALYEQMGSSLNLFADRLVDREVFGVEIRPAQLQALPPMLVILLAPIFTLIWTALGRRNANPNIPVKFAIGLMLTGLAYTMPLIGAGIGGTGHKVELFWLAMLLFLMVCGELCMAPVAMNMITRLCPKRVVGMMMGAYFLSLSIGSYAASHLASLASVQTGRVTSTSLDTAMATYMYAFAVFTAIGMGAGILLYLLSPLLYPRMHESSAQHGVSWISALYRYHRGPASSSTND